jgi:hypothetical protein
MRKRMNKRMNIWHAHVLMLLLNATMTIYGMEQDTMELEQRTEWKKQLSDTEMLRKYFFSQKLFKHFFYVDKAYTIPLDNPTTLLESFSNLIFASPNIVTSYNTPPGTTCVITAGRDLITANSEGKYITIGEDKYIPYNDISSECCSLAHTAEYTAAGFADGTVTVLHKNYSFTAPQCHKAPVTSIVCIPSQDTYIVGGGNTIKIFRTNARMTFKEGDLIKMEGKRHSFGNDEKGNPYRANIFAAAGAFIFLRTKDNRALMQSFYSPEAFDAIQDGTLSQKQKTFLLRQINGKKIANKDRKIFDTLCPTIRRVLTSVSHIEPKAMASLTHHHYNNLRIIPEEKS